MATPQTTEKPVNGGSKATGTAEPKTLTKEQIKELFVRYQKCEDAVTQAETNLQTAKDQRSMAVQQIAKKVGKGPFTWRGIKVRPSQYTHKNEETGEVESITWSMKTMEKETTVIE
jgi:hypothetical protein